MIERLKQDHRRIREHIARLRAFAERPLPPEDGEALIACRWELARDVMQNLMREERCIYAPLAQDLRPHAVATGARFHAWLDPAFASFRDHMARWTAAAVAAHWGEYRLGVLRLLDTLEQRMCDEETELFPLVSDAMAAAGRGAPDRNWAADGWAFRASIAAG